MAKTIIDVPIESLQNTILVVDDEESIRTSLSYMLQKKGYSVITASDGGEASDILDKSDIDLVISDIAMPVLDGLELVARIHKQYRPPEILLITGEPSLESATSAVRLGIFDYITKPLNYDALITTVHRALEKKTLLDEKARLEKQNERYLQDLEAKYDERSYHLLQTEEKYRSLFENSNVGVGVVNLEGKVIEVNDTMCKITGYSPKEFKQLSTLDLLIVSEPNKKLRGLLTQGTKVDDFETQLKRANGLIYWASLSSKPIQYRGEPALLTTLIDITVRKEYELSLQRALADKEEMLREIHHRTKNNMNVIISILNMQAYTTDDQHVKEILGKINDRIYSMSLVHEQIYSSKELSSIDLAKYIKALHMRHYSLHADIAKNIRIDLELEPSAIGLSQAIPLGLAVNEILANVAKHPFVDKDKGHVLIKLEKLQNNTIQIIVRDDGCGFPEDLDLSDPVTLGLHMAKILVDDQLVGKLELKNDRGAYARIQFSLSDEFENDKSISGRN